MADRKGCRVEMGCLYRISGFNVFSVFSVCVCVCVYVYVCDCVNMESGYLGEWDLGVPKTFITKF